MSNPLYTVSEEEKYFFDLRGYLIIRNALSDADLAQCNATIDHYADQIQTRSIGNGGLSRGSTALKGQEGRRELTGMLGWPTPHREPFRKLLVHPVVVSRLNEFSGQGFRLDHGPLLISAHKGAEGHSLHGAGEPFGQSVAYHQQNGKIYCRGITVAWQLTDVNPGDGGFACVPGSHKTAEPTPEGVRSAEDDMGLVYQPTMKAGDVLFFAETMTHGTLPWTSDGERRSVLYKYASRAAARAVGKHFTPQERYGDWVHELTPEQQAVLYGPGVHHGNRLPFLESDGQTVTVSEKK
jgi:ectoine hydroxylase-related dioxygenase (phytanoyl-CoA dioxygenase family)